MNNLQQIKRGSPLWAALILCYFLARYYKDGFQRRIVQTKNTITDGYHKNSKLVADHLVISS